MWVHARSRAKASGASYARAAAHATSTARAGAIVTDTPHRVRMCPSELSGVIEATVQVRRERDANWELTRRGPRALLTSSSPGHAVNRFAREKCLLIILCSWRLTVERSRGDCPWGLSRSLECKDLRRQAMSFGVIDTAQKTCLYYLRFNCGAVSRGGFYYAR